MAADNKTFYIEKDTNYALQVEYATNINFDEIKRIAKLFVMQLPEALQNKIYNDLEHGEQILDSEPQLNMYLYSFGNMHQAKMQHAFSNIDKDWFDNQEIEIIDYGCGQALATMLYHDYLQDNGISQTVSKITLIEPSEKALCRAGLHAKAFYPEAEIHTINKLLNDVAPTEISHSGKPVLHLFSNILDIEVVDLHHLATLAQAENEETDTLWVCVSPFFGNHKDNRIPCFLDILNQPKTYTFQRRKGTWQNQWTINCIIAEQKREEILSTEVTDEDIDNGIKDEYGVLYSPDGKRLLKGNKDITSYTVKEGTEVICDNAFKFGYFDNKSLESIVIPNSVTKIGVKPFNLGIELISHSNRFVVEDDLLIDLEEKKLIQCLKNKKHVDIPNSVTSIGDKAFSSCESLQSIVIPNSVTKIGGWAFPSGIELISHSNRFVVEDDLLIDLEEKRLIQCLKNKKHVDIPNSVTEIGDSAFYWCTSLQSIVIPDSVTEIGKEAFYRCLSLQNIVIPDSVTKIGDGAFEECRSLQSIVIPDSVTKIGDYAFNWCKSLQSIDIPESVTKIGDGAFEECRFSQSIVIPDSVTEIGNQAFWGCSSLKSIVIPDSVTKIGNQAFEGCSSLQSIVIPDSVTEIGNASFPLGKEIISHSDRFVVEDDLLIDRKGKRLIQCVKDKDIIVIPKSVTSIGDSAFYGCKSLQSIVIPYSVTSIGNSAFEYCRSLQSIFIPYSVTKIGDGAFKSCSLLQSIVIPDLVTEIGKEAFYGCRSLQSIVIPDSVTEIGKRAFENCLSLKGIVIPEAVTSIGDRAFFDCSSLQSIVILRYSVTKIGERAFEACRSLQSIVIPDSVTEIGDGAFWECSSLQSIVIPNSVTKIGKDVFYWCLSLQSIFIPDSVTKIGDGAFKSCKSLQSIVIPDSVTKIGNGAFGDCKSLQSIVIPDSVTEIGKEAFYGCSIVIPKGTKEHFKGVLDEYYHKFIKEIDYKKIYNGLGFCYEFGMGYKRKKAKEYYAKAKELEDKDKVEEYRKDAEQGDATAQFKLGKAYCKGEGVEKNYAEALKWFTMSAKQESASGQNGLGCMYKEGYEVEQDYTEALKWFRKSAEQGYATAQCNLGVMYEYGQGVEQDYTEAVKWYRKSAEQGYAGAQCNLGAMYYKGQGVEQDYTEALKLFRKSAEQGYAGAQCNLGVMFYNGKGVEQDYTEAVKWYRKSAEQGYAEAQCNLGVMYEYGQGVEQDYTEAVKWYRKSAEQGYETAKKKSEEYGLMLETDDLPPSLSFC